MPHSIAAADHRLTVAGLALLLLSLLLPVTPGAAAETKGEAKNQNGLTLLQQRDDRLVAKLPNRLIVIAQELPTAPVVSSQVWVETGTVYEQEFNGLGLSHFLEHLVLSGTTRNHSEKEQLQALGRIGAETNAFTSYHDVRYYINTTAEHTSEAISIVSDWVQNASLTRREFEREKDVILREFGTNYGDPDKILWKLTARARWKAHPARQPVLGYRERFKTVTLDQVRAFYERMYVPNNMVFVVVGDIDKRAVIEQVRQLWADEKAKPLPTLEIAKEPKVTGPRTKTGYADIDRPRVRLLWPGTELGTEHDYALDLLSYVLGEGESSRLKTTIRDDAQLVTSISAFNASYPWGSGFFAIDSRLSDHALNAAPSESDESNRFDETIATVKAAVLEQVRDVVENGISEKELGRAKALLRADIIRSNQTAAQIAYEMADDTFKMADPDRRFRYLKRIERLNGADLQKTAERFFKDQRLITVNLLPTDEQHSVTILRPDDTQSDTVEPAARRTIHLDNEHRLDALKRNLGKPLERGGPVAVGEPTRRTLDNGLRVIVQRSTVVPAVSMRLYWRGGLLGDGADRAGTSRAMAEMLTKGTEQYSAEALATTVERLGANLDADAGNNTTSVQAGGLKADWPALMRLMGEVALRPTFPEREWQKLQPRLVADINDEAGQWYGELSQLFRKTYYQNHPWSATSLGKRRVIRSLTARDLARHHHQQIAGAKPVLAVVGDVRPEAVFKRAKRVFGDWPGDATRDPEPPVPSGDRPRLVQQRTDKLTAAVKVGFGPGPERTHPDYPATRVLANILSDFPSGWLEQQLRGEGGGLAYTVGAYLHAGRVPGHFAILFNTVSDRAPHALKKAMASVRRARQQTVDQNSLRRGRATALAGEFLGRQSNGERATQMALDTLYGMDDLTGAAFRQAVKATDAEKLKEVANKYLRNPTGLVISHKPIRDAALQAALSGDSIPPESNQPPQTQPSESDKQKPAN